MDRLDPFAAALDACEATRLARRARLLPRLAAAGRVLDRRRDYRARDQRAAAARALLRAALLAPAEAGDLDIAGLVRAVLRGREAGHEGAERGRAARDFVRALLAAARLPEAEALLAASVTIILMTADDCAPPEWAPVLHGAGRFIDALETAQPRLALSAMGVLLRSIAPQPA